MRGLRHTGTDGSIIQTAGRIHPDRQPFSRFLSPLRPVGYPRHTGPQRGHSAHPEQKLRQPLFCHPAPVSELSLWAKKRRDTEKSIWVQNIIHELNSIASSISINTDLSYCYTKNIFMSPDLKYFAKDSYLSLLSKVNNNLHRFERQVGTNKNNTAFVEEILRDIKALIETMK